MKTSFFVPVMIAGLSLAFLGQGCFSSTPSGPNGPDMGVWKTVDGGTTWVNKKAFVSGPKVTAGVASVSVLSMNFDPQDRTAIYLGTSENGVLYSLDAGESWQQSKSLGSGKVNDVAVDPKNKCTMYAVSGNKIYKTVTCGRDWNQAFFNPRTETVFTHVAIDWYNPLTIYAGTNDGDIYRSSDSGVSWQTSQRVDGNAVTSMVVDPHDSRIVYVGTQSQGIWKTADSGTSWVQIKKEFGDQLSDGARVIQIVPDPVTANTIYDVSRYGILKSADGGATWSALQLTSPPGTVKINALAIDPKNNQHLVFAGVSTLQFSNDGGKTWTPKKLPTSQAGGQLLFDPIEPNTIYLGVVPSPKQN